MRNILFIVLILITGGAQATVPGMRPTTSNAPAIPTGSETVNQWISLALQVESAKLTDQVGKFACQSGIGDVTYSKKIEEAHVKAVLLCIRKKCDGITAQVNAEVDRLRSMSKEDLVDLLTGLGQGDKAEQVAEMLKRGEYGNSTSCQTSQNARFLIYDSCALQAYSCGKVSRR